jgi:hypothetical protein
MGAKLGIPLYGNRGLKTFWRKWKSQGNGENYIRSNFMICSSHNIVGADYMKDRVMGGKCDVIINSTYQNASGVKQVNAVTWPTR